MPGPPISRSIATAPRYYKYTIKEVTADDMKVVAQWKGPKEIELEETEYLIITAIEEHGAGAVYTRIVGDRDLQKRLLITPEDWDWELLRARLHRWKTTIARNIAFFINIKRRYDKEPEKQ